MYIFLSVPIALKKCCKNTENGWLKRNDDKNDTKSIL